MKETKKSTNFKRKSRYNPNRRSFVTEDGKLAYIVWDEESKRDITHYYEIGSDGITEELVIMLDENDHDWDLSERYQRDNEDYKFQNELRKHYENSEDFSSNSVENIIDTNADICSILFPDIELTNGAVKKAAEFISTLTEDQQLLVYDHLGSMLQLTEIRRKTIARTQKPTTQQAFSNRWKKIIVRACKFFDVPVPSKRKA